MFGPTGILIALIVTDDRVWPGVFLVRSFDHCGSHGQDPRLCRLVRSSGAVHRHGHVLSQAAFPTDGILHFVPQHGNPRKKSVRADASYIPAQHFQNHLVPPDKACYTCHTDYTMYGPLKDKLKGLRYLYMEYVSTPPKINSFKRRVQQPAVPALPCGHAQL